MKKILVLLTVLLSVSVSYAQTETFDSNTFGWTEFTSKNGKAIISEGKLHIESSNSGGLLAKTNDGFTTCTCWAPMDPSKNFLFSSNVFVKKVDDDNAFGVIFNYYDDCNYCAFVFNEENAFYYRFEEGKLVGRMIKSIKLAKKKKSTMKLDIKHETGKVEFLIDDVQAIEVRYINLESTGIGYFTAGKMSVDVEDMTITQ